MNGQLVQIASRVLNEDENPSDEFFGPEYLTGPNSYRDAFLSLGRPFLATCNYNAARTKVKVTRYRE